MACAIARTDLELEIHVICDITAMWILDELVVGRGSEEIRLIVTQIE
jgi:hypothetical protein